ncbi:MAG: DUF4398 domain-containing protein [Rhodothermales bacterium]
MTPLRFASAAPVLFAALALLIAGCAGSKLPPPDLSASRSAIAQADQAGASEAAPLALRNARQKVQQAEEASNRGDYRRAQMLSEQAEIDAKLAEATARSAKAQAAVDELRESIRVLRDEINRNRPASGGQ